MRKHTGLNNRMKQIMESVMNSKMRNLMFGGACVAVAVMGLPALAADGNLVQLTIQTAESMEGMGSMPPQTTTRKVCMSAQRFDTEQLLKSDNHEGCKLTNYKSSAKLVTFDLLCEQPMAITSHGEFHLTDAANFTGKVHSEAQVEGHAMSIDATYTGQKLGSCNYTPEKA